jgi:hypothetical protein
VGASEPAVDAYLDHLKYDIAHTRRRLRHAERTGEVAEAQRLRPMFEEKDVLYSEERDRLTERDMPMLVGGAVTLGVGGASLVASGVLALSAVMIGLSQIGLWSDDNDRGTDTEPLLTASAALLGIGIAGVNAGIPMLIVGIRQRKLRSPDDVPESAPGGVSGAGAGLVWSFK